MAGLQVSIDGRFWVSPEDITERVTNGIVEGTNNRLRMITRRAFGLHSADAFISMLYLCCGGITLHPPLPQRHFDIRYV